MLRLQGFSHLRIWPRGVDTTLFHPDRRSEELRSTWLTSREQPATKMVLLYVGRISWEKNLNLLVQTYQQMNTQHCHLVIVGEGPALTEIQQKLIGYPVTYTGYLTGEALATAYASADIFAFPSHTETFGQVVLEAMASHLPVVGLLSEGVCDLVHHDQTGFLLDVQRLSEEEQVKAYQERLTQIISDSHLRHNMGQAAFVEAQQYSWYDAMERIVQGYLEVIENAKTPVAA